MSSFEIKKIYTFLHHMCSYYPNDPTKSIELNLCIQIRVGKFGLMNLNLNSNSILLVKINC